MKITYIVTTAKAIPVISAIRSNTLEILPLTKDWCIISSEIANNTPITKANTAAYFRVKEPGE